MLWYVLQYGPMINQYKSDRTRAKEQFYRENVEFDPKMHIEGRGGNGPRVITFTEDEVLRFNEANDITDLPPEGYKRIGLLVKTSLEKEWLEAHESELTWEELPCCTGTGYSD
jgi:hypothetical protein